MEIKFYNSKESEEDKAELERFQQANDFISGFVVFDAPRKPGGYTEKRGYRYSRLDELKAHHFDHSFRKWML